jgi:hypothetical protein
MDDVLGRLIRTAVASVAVAVSVGMTCTFGIALIGRLPQLDIEGPPEEFIRAVWLILFLVSLKLMRASMRLYRRWRGRPSYRGVWR